MSSPHPSDHPSDGDSAQARAVQVVEAYLQASMIPDPVRASRYVGADLQITFTGARQFSSVAEVAAFNASRYRKVGKQFERTEAVASAAPDEFTVYNSGTLFGEWPDGEAFSGNRYIDRFTVRRDKIVRMEVWNDSAERLLLRAGLVKA